MKAEMLERSHVCCREDCVGQQLWGSWTQCVTGQGRSLVDKAGRKHVEQHLELERKQNRGCQHIGMTRGTSERAREQIFRDGYLTLLLLFNPSTPQRKVQKRVLVKREGAGTHMDYKHWQNHSCFFYHLRHAHTKIQCTNKDSKANKSMWRNRISFPNTLNTCALQWITLPSNQDDLPGWTHRNLQGENVGLEHFAWCQHTCIERALILTKCWVQTHKVWKPRGKNSSSSTVYKPALCLHENNAAPLSAVLELQGETPFASSLFLIVLRWAPASDGTSARSKQL